LLKKIFIICGSILLVVILSGLIIKIYLSDFELDLEHCMGEIVLGNSYDEITVYKPSVKSRKTIAINTEYSIYDCNKKKNSVLVVDYNEKPTINDNAIFEYNYNNNEYTPIVKCKTTPPDEYSSFKDDISTVHFDKVEYIPGRNAISYKWWNDLYIYDTQKNEEAFITKVSDKYSWSKDGSNIIYCPENDSNYIYKYYINSKTTEKLFSGSSPEYSNNNKLIAYTPDNLSKELFVRDISTGKVWKYRAGGIIVNYKFSPDDKLIAIFELNKKFIVPSQRGPVKIWDFKNNLSNTLVRNYRGHSIVWR
jgi:hypothetical protein